MNFGNIPRNILAYIIVSKEDYDVKQIIISQARRFYEMTEICIPLVSQDSPSHRCEEKIYLCKIYPSIMSIISYEYTLRLNTISPSRHEFISYIERTLQTLPQSTHHQIKMLPFYIIQNKD